MIFFGVLGLILLLALGGRRPDRGSYIIVAMVAMAAAVYEYFK
jgi:hypothetical protein